VSFSRSNSGFNLLTDKKTSNTGTAENLISVFVTDAFATSAILEIVRPDNKWDLTYTSGDCLGELCGCYQDSVGGLHIGVFELRQGQAGWQMENSELEVP